MIIGIYGDIQTLKQLVMVIQRELFKQSEMTKHGQANEQVLLYRM